MKCVDCSNYKNLAGTKEFTCRLIGNTIFYAEDWEDDPGFPLFCQLNELQPVVKNECDFYDKAEDIILTGYSKEEISTNILHIKKLIASTVSKAFDSYAYNFLEEDHHILATIRDDILLNVGAIVLKSLKSLGED